MQTVTKSQMFSNFIKKRTSSLPPPRFWPTLYLFISTLFIKKKKKKSNSIAYHFNYILEKGKIIMLMFNKRTCLSHMNSSVGHAFMIWVRDVN